MPHNSLAALIAIDVDDKKLELARKYGAIHVINSIKEDAVVEVEKITEGHMADFCIEGTGIPMVLNQCAAYLRTGRGRLCLMSYHESLAKEFNSKFFSDKGIQMLNPHPNYSENQLDDCRRAVNLINKGIFVQDDFISHTFTLDEIQTAYVRRLYSSAYASGHAYTEKAQII